jgi:hypothetical protein
MCMTTTNNDTRNWPVEMAYRKFGAGWKRRTFRSEKEIDRWFYHHGSEVAETRWAEDPR